MLAGPSWLDRSLHFFVTRQAVRVIVQQVGQGLGNGVVIGFFGSADSLVSTAGACVEALGPEGALAGRKVHAVVVDHQPQQDSTEVAERTAHMVREMGATAEVVAVDINNNSDRSSGYEARLARHMALRKVTQPRGTVLTLAHTLDDQAEAAMLRLARGGDPQVLPIIRDSLTWSDGTRILRSLLGMRCTDT